MVLSGTDVIHCLQGHQSPSYDWVRFSVIPASGEPRPAPRERKHQCPRQNQYRPHTKTIAKSKHNKKAMRKASDIGSSNSFSDWFDKPAPDLRIEWAASWTGDAAQVAKGRALTNPPSRAAQ